jgi:hypothetical protein
MPKSNDARMEPALVRVFAHYTCFGDGLCCTDLHGLGPLTKREVRQLVLISDEVVVDGDESGFDEPMLRTRGDGGCLFLGVGRCELHAALGADAKPEGCRRFPLGLVATPSGGRITTRHRCPCRTLGDRPPIRPEAVLPSLTTPKGRLVADREVAGTMRIAKGKRVSFEEYEAIESEVFSRLLRGDAPAAVLDAPVLTPLTKTSWLAQANAMSRGVDDTRFGFALGWFAESLRVLAGKERREVADLAWKDAFDRAEARSPHVRDPDAMIADWIMDHLWSLEWVDIGGTFAHARHELRTRLAVVEDIRAILTERGHRPDRATAEAISVADVIGDSEWWEDVIALLQL